MSCGESIDAAIDLSSGEHTSDPFPTYEYLRDNAPVCRVNPNGFWAISRYDDVKFAFKNHELFSSSAFETIHHVDWLDPSCWPNLFILTQDPPVHTLHRAVFNRAFVKRVIHALVPFMRNKIRALIKGVGQRTDIEFTQDIACPYAASVILKVVGTENMQGATDLHRWIRCLEQISPIRPDDETIREIEAVITQQNEYFDSVIADRRKRPRQDLVSEMVNAVMDDGKTLDSIQLRSALHLIVGAGFHSAMHALSKSVLYLSRNPHLHKILAGSPILIPAFIEEMLRYDGPVHGLMRRTRQAVTLSDVTIPEGEAVVLLTASANRDPRHFCCPDTFDVSRKNTRDHLAFGHGVHTCIGAALARLELKIALEELLTAFDSITCPPDNQLDWLVSITNHGFSQLPVRLHCADTAEQTTTQGVK